VEDFACGISAVLERGEAGQIYNCGGPDERQNIEVVRQILRLTGASESLLEPVRDRPGHDRRYSLCSDKLGALGWSPQTALEEGLEQTVRWYEENRWWWEPIRSGTYREYYQRQYGRALGAPA
jgi:dTDP-glucose 4,6-dehydratase